MTVKSKFLAPLIIVSAMAIPAQASDYTCKSGPKSEWMSKEAVTQSMVKEGYDIRKVKVGGGCYEVYVTKDGKKLEVFVNPTTGTVVKIKEK